MNDLAIIKRIAEIDEVSGHEFMGVFVPSLHYNEAVNESHSNSYSFDVNRYAYNPLTDDALCFQLMVKYDVDLISPYRKNNETKWEAQMFTVKYADTVNASDDNPSKAICLAIIGANNE